MSDDADRLAPLREQIAIEEGIAEWAPELSGGNASQIRESAIRIRDRLGLSYDSPTLESAIARQQRAQAQRNAKMDH